MRRHGSYGQIHMDPEPPAEPAPPVTAQVASMNKWDLDLKRERADVTSFGDRNKSYVQGLPDITGNLGGFWDAPQVEIFDVALGEAPAWLKLVPSSLDATFYFNGLAYLDANIEVDAGGSVNIGSTFAAAGEWTRLPAPAALRKRAA
jgi:hypothetical protein